MSRTFSRKPSIRRTVWLYVSVPNPCLTFCPKVEQLSPPAPWTNSRTPTLAAAALDHELTPWFSLPSSLMGPLHFSLLSLARPLHVWVFVTQGCTNVWAAILPRPGPVRSGAVAVLQSPLLTMKTDPGLGQTTASLCPFYVHNFLMLSVH